MAKLLVRLLLLPALLLLAACAGSPNYFTPVPPTSAERGMLYLYRPPADNPGLQPLRRAYPVILVDGRSVGVLEFNQYFNVDLAAGRHSIVVTGLVAPANWEVADIRQDVSIAPGEIKYLKLDVQYQLDDMTIGQSGPKYRIFLTPMDSPTAVDEIRHTAPRP
ncbi:hypothetical protein [Pseudomonas sp. N040]|uniref:hypothetical protein n=1 Tax=Pseudomonas sp. N040 TaxID=2785325 RepID=UPI0018A314B5|nr:hypothetical protein [Pseudomonas sp. N040]MBF7728915.1 hypothetical protein [Pseudomonas sp. N040]MBW7012555.1 DUF2846 domain-containing protein [Pseudomonas sp. N040]